MYQSDKIWMMKCPRCGNIMNKINPWDIWKCLTCKWNNDDKNKILIFSSKAA